MRARSLMAFLLLYVLAAWIGSAGVSYAVIQFAGRGDTGATGAAGQPGPRGPQGLPGPTGLSGDAQAQEMLKRLASLWAVQTVSNSDGGGFVSFNNSRVTACVDYIMTGKGSYADCPGFSR